MGVASSFWHPVAAWTLLVAAGLFVLLSWTSALWARGDPLSILISPLLYVLIYTGYGLGFLRGLLTRS